MQLPVSLFFLSFLCGRLNSFLKSFGEGADVVTATFTVTESSQVGKK